MIDFARAFDVINQLSSYGCRYDALVLACGSQMGKSDTVLDVIGQTLDERPAPILYVGPSQSFVEREIEPRLMAMLNGTKRLSDKVARGKRMTKHRKMVGGVPVALAWAGSASQVAGMAAKVALIDELDRTDSSVQGEGDPFTLLEARGFSYADRIRAAISTPLSGAVDIEVCPTTGLEFWRRMSSEDVESPIWRLWQQGTRHHFAWPCPHCDEHFVPRFKQLRWEGWPELVNPVVARRSAHIECPRCAGVIDNAQKAQLNARGVYVAPGQHVADGVAVGPLTETTTLSLWVSGLCSPMVSFGERAASYIEARQSGEQSRIQAVINTGFGELFAPGSGDVPEWEEVASLKRPYRRGEVPPGIRFLTLAVDVQKNRLVYTIRGWGAAGSSWLVDFGELFGPTTETEVWQQLAELVSRPIGGLTIHRGFIDSGFRPGKPVNLPVNRVYEFCRRFPRRIYATKGKATQDKPLVLAKNDVNAKGEVRKYGLDLIWLDTDYCKSWVHERIRWEPDRPGAWLLPQDTTDDYCKQIVSEARVRKASGAPEWVARSRNNHFLDCEGMQAGLAHLLNVHQLVARKEDHTLPAELPPPEQPQAVMPVAQVAPPPTSVPRSAAPVAARAEQDARRARIAKLGARMMGR